MKRQPFRIRSIIYCLRLIVYAAYLVINDITGRVEKVDQAKNKWNIGLDLYCSVNSKRLKL